MSFQMPQLIYYIYINNIYNWVLSISWPNIYICSLWPFQYNNLFLKLIWYYGINNYLNNSRLCTFEKYIIFQLVAALKVIEIKIEAFNKYISRLLQNIYLVFLFYCFYLYNYNGFMIIGYTKLDLTLICLFLVVIAADSTILNNAVI